MKNYLNKFEFIKETKKYKLYHNKDNDELVIYNGFSVFHFKLDDLGNDVYRGAYQPKGE